MTVSQYLLGCALPNSGKGGAPKLTFDGKPVEGDLVPYAKAGATVIVDCEV